ncbi:hypothetical protein BDW74DRAFT_144716 [Aspergillus multicolor]|uniref:uncharacterized protein n=1 Tax=Aspergillus multicolor TaxID=41759 RepID=UPI003CCDEA30
MDLYELHHKRYDRLCPPVTEIDHPDWVRWINHCESIQHLRAWTPRFPQGKEHSTIPNRKLPNKLMHVHIDQHAYEEWARAYNESLIEMLNGPWVAYQNAKANVERALTNVVASGTLSAGGVGRIRMHWQRCLEEFNEWENKVPKLSLLSWVGTVTQVYRALIDRVEYGWVFLERFLMSAPEEIQACWWKRLLTAQGVVDIAQLQDIVPANLRERLLLGDEHAV